MKTFPWLISIMVHGLVLLIGGLSLQQAMVGVAPGRNSIEVNLVAAPGESTPVPDTSPPARPEEPVLPPLPLPPLAEMAPPSVPLDPMPSPEIRPITPPAPAFAPLSGPSKPSQSKAKLSRKPSRSPAPNAGKDSVTAQSLAGAIVDEEPDYLSNPAPVYPQAARDDNQEGVVTLDVIVDTDGCAETVQVFSSSGYYLLDAAAREAVQHYRFRPAMLSGVKVRSHVQVPIRFRLDG